MVLLGFPPIFYLSASIPMSVCTQPLCPSTLCCVLLCRAAQLLCARDAAPFFVSRISGSWSGPFLPWSESDCEVHNVWNSVFSLCFHVQVGPLLEDVPAQEDLGRLALSCRFVLEKSVRQELSSAAWYYPCVPTAAIIRRTTRLTGISLQDGVMIN